MHDIWYLLTSDERYVYHYTTSKTLAEYILPSKRLRFSRFAQVNDPRESKERVFSFASASHLNPDFPTLESALNQILKRSWRIGCFVRDVPEAVMAGRVEAGIITQQRAYERGYSRSSMWAHYAERGQGACLVFDRAKLNAAVRGAAGHDKVHAGPVVYKNRTPITKLDTGDELTFSLLNANKLGLAAAAEAHIDKNLDLLYFRKSEEWCAEREYRWAVYMPTDDEFLVPIEDSIAGLLLGDLFPDCRKSVVKAFARKHPEMKLAVMEWQNGFPQPYDRLWSLLTLDAAPSRWDKWTRLFSWK